MSPQAKTMVVLVALLGVAGVLGAYAYFGVEKADEAAEQKKATDEKLFAAREGDEKAPDGGTLPAAEFNALTVSAKGEQTSLEKKDGKWWITAPVSALADESVVSSLVGQLNSGKVKATVEEKPTAEDLAKYGLDKPRFSVKGRARVPDGKGGGADKEVSLEGGIENTFDGSVYLRKANDPKVYSVEGFVRSALEKTTYDLRDKAVVALEEAKLTRIEVKTQANAYTLERDAQKAWRLVKPVALPAEASTLVQMINAVAGERALSFPKDSPEDRKRLGLEAPAVDASFTREGGEVVRLRLAKAPVDGVEKAFALREDKGGALLAEVSPGALAHLDKAPQDLRDKSVLTFDKDKVARVSFTPAGGGAEIVVEKAPTPDAGGEEWVVVKPEKGPAKKWKMSTLVWTLGSLKAAAFGEAPKDWSKYGITDKSRSATLFDAQGKALAKLLIGKDVPGKQSTVYVRGTQDNVLEVESSRLSEIPSTVGDVIDRPAPALTAGADAGPPAFPAFGTSAPK